MTWSAIIILVCVALQRTGELVLDRKNTQALLGHGGVEVGARHYPLFIILHSSWLISLFLWVFFQSPAVHWELFGFYILLQAGRVWVIATLGKYWTTRIIHVPGAPLVLAGPYRYVRHPNYWVVVCEIALLPMVFGAWQIAVVFTALNGALLFHRIRVENRALQARR